MMMDSIREGVKKPWAKILIFAICISFVGAGYFTSALFLGDPYAAAVVNGESVNTREFENAYQRTKQQYEQRFGVPYKQIIRTEEQERNFRENVLQNLISKEVTLQASGEMGLRAPTAQIRNIIQNLPELQSEGVYSSELLDRLLISAGISRGELRADVESNFILSQLSSGVVNTEFSLDSEVSEEYKITGQQRTGRALSVQYSLFDKEIEIGDEEISSYYEETKEQYRVEEKVSIDYIELSIDSLTQQIDVSDAEVQNYYTDNIDRFQTDEQRRVSHILVAFDGDEAGALEKAQLIKEKLNAGEDFVALVKSESNDEFSAENDGDLGILAEGDMEDEFYAAMSSLQKIGDISEPTKTSFGYHLIKLTELIEGETQPLIEVKETVLSNIKKQKAEEAFYAKSKILEEKSFEIADSLNEVSQDIDVEIKTSPLFGRNSATGIFANQQLVEEAFGENVLEARINSNVISLNDTQVIVFRLNSHQPSDIQALEDVKERLVATIKSNKSKEAALEYANSIKDKLVEKTDVTSLISAKALAWKDLDKITRTSSSLPYRQMQHFFAMTHSSANDASIEVMEDANELVVFALNKIEEGLIDKADEAIKTQTAQRLNRFYSDANYGSLVEQKRNQADVSLNLNNVNR